MSCIPYLGSVHSSPEVGSLVDIPVVDNLADSPVDNPAGIQVDSSLPGVRIVAGRAKSIRLVEGWSSRFEVVGSGNMVLERA